MARKSRKVTPAQPAPLCMACGQRMKAFKLSHRKVASSVVTWDGNPPAYGPYGDNAACSLTCINTLFQRILSSVPNVLELLPPAWRLDKLESANSQEKAAKLRRTELSNAKKQSLIAARVRWWSTQ